MRYAITWIKSNPITVISAVVVVAALGFLVWVQIQGSDLQAQMAEREAMIRQIRSLKSRSVEIPPEQPDAPSETISGVTINQLAIDQLEKLYGRMDEEYRQIFEHAVSINRGGHVLLREGLFPEASNAGMRILARDDYWQAFQLMLQPYPPEAEPKQLVLPRLDAGMPPPQEVLQDAVARVEADFRSAPGYGRAQLSPEEQQQQQQALYEEKQAKLFELLQRRARNLHLYAQTDINEPGFPFYIQPWAETREPPEEHQLWEGQLELWIQQDIAQAIALTNEANDPAVSVIEAPIKRLLSIEVIPGYVGLHTRGGLFPTSSGVMRADGTYPPPIGGLTGDADQPVSDNFYVGPTGRVSNALYDVRHARIEMIVDYSRLPEFFNNLASVNFMTVLKVQLQDVDEYEALQEGFIYGTHDVVRATILIETIWLRNWTEQYMPSLVRQYLGIDEPTDLNARPGQNMPYMPGAVDPFGVGPGGYPMGY